MMELKSTRLLIYTFCGWLAFTPLLASAAEEPELPPPMYGQDAKPTPPPAQEPETHRNTKSYLSPSAVGWGNLLVPGLGATLRGQPTTGLAEAGLEIGTFYGGTFGVKEGGVQIDGSVTIPTQGDIFHPTLGQVAQEFGLKYHFFNTFYHYQQASLAIKDTPREKNNPQPLYTGTWKDMAAAPFRWENLSSPWVFPAILVSGGFLAYTYHTQAIGRISVKSTPATDSLYGFSQIGAIPFGGLFGEEPLFRGFIQREARYYTGSLWLSILAESAAFTAIHPAELQPSAFLSGLYFGYLVERNHGNLEEGMAIHFWVNVLSGVSTYFLFRRAEGKSAPWAPPLTASFSF